MKVLSLILMSARPDQLMFRVLGFFGGEVGGGGCSWSGCDPRGWGGVTGACQSDVLTDKRAVGTGVRGHPGPSWAKLGAFYWFINLLTPLPPKITPCKGNALADEWRDHVIQKDGAWDKGQGEDESCGGGEMSKGEFWVNLEGGLGCAFK